MDDKFRDLNTKIKYKLQRCKFKRHNAPQGGEEYEEKPKRKKMLKERRKAEEQKILEVLKPATETEVRKMVLKSSATRPPRRCGGHRLG